MSRPARPTIGFYSPLPPDRTGVADYSAALLRALGPRATVRIGRDGDINLYHLGNNQIHAGIYHRALARPGVAVLHDAVLQHFYLGSLTEDRYVEEFVFNYGEWRRSLAHELWRNRASSGLDAKYFQYPMLKRIAAASRAVVVHNPAAAALVRAHAPGCEVVEIPHLVEDVALPDAFDIQRFRAGLGIPPAAFLFGVFGYLRESKRLLTILRCFANVHRARPDTRLLVAGEFVSPDLARAAAPWLAQPGVVRIGHQSERRFLVAAAAVDACLNLRYPSAAETSGIAVRLKGLGKPVFLTSGPENSAFSATACLRIESGLAEAADLFEHMILVAGFPEIGREVGRQASRHIRRCHAPERIAERYWNTLCLSQSRTFVA